MTSSMTAGGFARMAILLFPLAASAHMVSMSTGELRVEGRRAIYELRMPLYEVAHVAEPERSLFEHIRFSSEGHEGRLVNKTCSAQAGTYVCTASYEFPEDIDQLAVVCTFAQITVPNHVHLLRAVKGDKSDQAVFDLSFTEAELRFRPPTRIELAVRETAAGAIRALGGAAPLLFLVSLLLAARVWRELAALAGMFLAGELASCLLEPRFGWQLSPRFIEAAAALTIAYLAVEILLLPQAGKRWLVVGVLGLVHGYYFSLFLRNSGYGPGYFLGGVAAAELLFLVLGWLVWSRIARLRVTQTMASVLLAVGMIWFIVRLKG